MRQDPRDTVYTEVLKFDPIGEGAVTRNASLNLNTGSSLLPFLIDQSFSKNFKNVFPPPIKSNRKHIIFLKHSLTNVLSLNFDV